MDLRPYDFVPVEGSAVKTCHGGHRAPFSLFTWHTNRQNMLEDLGIDEVAAIKNIQSRICLRC